MKFFGLCTLAHRLAQPRGRTLGSCLQPAQNRYQPSPPAMAAAVPRNRAVGGSAGARLNARIACRGPREGTLLNLRQISLPRGPERLLSRERANQKVVALVTPWLDAVLSSGKRLPLTLPAVSHFSGSAQATDEVLEMQLWSPLGAFRAERPHRGETALMATIGVARNPAAGDKLWAALLQQAGADWRDAPIAPWCGVVPKAEGMVGHAGASRWLPELHSSIAFAWLAK